MRIINILIFISFVCGTTFQGSLGLIGQFSKGEFKDQGVPTGFGIDVLLGENFNESGDLCFFVNGRYLYGGKAKYLKQGDIEFSDPNNGPVTTTFNWSESATDLFQISFGLMLDFINK